MAEAVRKLGGTMQQAELKRITNIVHRFAPKLGTEMTQTLAYNLAQAFPKESFKFGRQEFLASCGTEPTSCKA